MGEEYSVDFAVSYAGEDAHIVGNIASRLQKLGFEVFFARERNHLLAGRDGEEFFEWLFRIAKQVIVFVSEQYKKKEWTRYEWDIIRERDPENRFIPVRLDDTKLLGLSSNILYLPFRGDNYDEIVHVCAKKLILFEKLNGIRRETEFESILKAIEEDSEGSLAKAYQLVVDGRERAPLEDYPFPKSDYTALYDVVQEEWCDFSRIRRLVARVVVPPNLSEDELQFNLEHCATVLFNQFKPDAVMVLGYKDDPNGYTVDGHYTAGRAVLAPFGKWEKAEEGFAYNIPTNQFRFSVDLELTYRVEPTPTEERDREIFYQLVKRQDAIPLEDPDYSEANQRAKINIADEYEISLDELNAIIRRGAAQHWPTPPPSNGQ